MNLYTTKVTTVIPAKSESEALGRFEDEQDLNSVQESDFNILIPECDYSKIFKFARTLCEINAPHEVVAQLTRSYVQKLGYELTDDEVWDGILKWAERLAEFDEDEIESWLA